jgi:heptosyltransferase-3
VKSKKILVLCLRYLGDTLLTRPVLRALSHQFPQSQIDILIPQGTEVALGNFSCSFQILSWPRKQSKAASIILHILRQNYDITIDLTGNDRTAFLTLISHAKIRASYEKKKPRWQRWRSRLYNIRVPHEKKKPHILYQHQKLIEACDVPFQGISLELKASEKAQKNISSLLTPYTGKKILVAHLTSRDMQKSLPISLVREVLTNLLKQNCAIVFTSGKALQEKDYITKCIQNFETSNLKIMPELSWDELIALIAKSDAYWGVDTAPTHLASDLQKPMLVHYGPSNAPQWHPLNPHAEIMISPCACLKTKQKQCIEGVSGQCFNNLSSNIIATILKTKLFGT